MELEIVRAGLEDKSVLRNLMELCQYDFSEYDGTEVDEHGLFGYRYLDNYWTEKGRHPFLVKVDGKLSGFALVRDASNTGNTHLMSEFFIMRKHRRSGIGRTVAHRVFDMFPGKWRVQQEAENLPAQTFWRKVISDYTDGRFEEIKEEGWNGPVQEFQSRGKET